MSTVTNAADSGQSSPHGELRRQQEPLLQPVSFLRQKQGRIVIAAGVLVGALLLSGCATQPPFGEITGGQGGNDDSLVVDDATADEVDGDTTGEAADDGPADKAENKPAPVGTIEVKVEQGSAGPRLFHLDASECLVSPDRIRGVGAGSEDGAGNATITIDTEPDRLLHGGTGTWLAKGKIELTVGDQVITADARMQDGLPSALDYRINGESVMYLTAWFLSGGGDTAGFVKMTCQ